MKNIAIIQARLGSSRLPYKMMLSLHGKALIEWVIKRTEKSKKLNGFIVAIPKTKENNILAKYIESLGVKVYRGSEDNVLNRFYEAAKIMKATQVIRICADNPLISAREIDNLLEFYEQNPCDYAYNHIPRNNNYPDGFGAEIISFELLEWLENNVVNEEEREHCFSYIWNNQENYSIKTFNPPDSTIAYPDIRLDIDTFDDYYKLSMKNIKIDSTEKEIIQEFRENI